MNEETVNQETKTEPGSEPARTFTQAEVDAIIGDRLTRERAKYADYEDLKGKAAELDSLKETAKNAQSKVSELQNQVDVLQKDINARNARDKVSAETGVPASVLTGMTEEECKQQADAIIKWRGLQPNYPASADGGEVTSFSGGKTRDKFAAWAEANLNM